MKDIILELLAIIISSIIVSLTCWYYKPNSTISAIIFLPVLILLLTLIYGLIKYIYFLHDKLSEKNMLDLPKLKKIEKNILVFTPSELFTTNSVASIWLIDTFEKIIGYGYVETVNTNKCLQVKVNYFFEEYNINYLEKHKNKIILRPTIRRDDLIKAVESEEENNDW